MPHDPVRVADTKAWLSKARQDLRAAALDLAASPPLLEDTLFHCQQAVEKALKALLTWHDRPFRKTHDLVELGGQCVEVIPEIEPILRRVAILTEYAWKYRYPGDEEQPKKADVRKTLSLAKEGVQAILALLPEEVTP